MDVGGFALITGAASGIGKACARAFIREGAAGVALVDINEEALEKTRTELEDEISGRAQGAAGEKARARVATYALDVTDAQRVQLVVAEAAACFGRLDYVVNAAGVMSGHVGGAADTETEDWKRTLDVNLHGTFHVLGAAARVMLAQEAVVGQRGSIVNVASILGLRGLASAAAYTASKHAVVGLTRVAALDYADRGLRVNAICPGFTDTPFLTGAGERLRALVATSAAATPMRRWARPDEIADGVLFLAGGRSSFVTGTTLAVDGGYTAK
ncbi:hypothetical protein E4U21_004964 [Claviceps maximensis]|nr:hypothetical protein E4U21_004964 [Claviceps maximensis]